MILEHKGARPTIDADVRVAPNAVICGAALLTVTVVLALLVAP